MPILSDDPTSTPHDKLAILQDSEKWSAIPGYPGPAAPAIDEIYNNFIIPDMLAKTATGSMSAEDSVKWATQQCEAIFKKWAASLIAGDRIACVLVRGPGHAAARRDASQMEQSD